MSAQRSTGGGRPTRTPRTGSGACTSRTPRWTRCSAGRSARSCPAATDEAATDLLAELDARAGESEAAGARIRLRALAPAFALDAVDVDLLMVALAPDLDPRFERLYGYLHDDVSRRRASVGLALELGGRGRGDGADRDRLGPLAPLVARHLMIVEDADRPMLTRALRVPDRVIAHLLGDDAPDPVVDALLTPWVRLELPEAATVARGLAAGLPLVYVRERAGASGLSLGGTALAAGGRDVVALDLTRVAVSDDPHAIAAAASREARAARRGSRGRSRRGARGAGTGRGARLRRAAGPGDPHRRPRLGPGLVPRATARRRCAAARRRPAPRPVACAR